MNDLAVLSDAVDRLTAQRCDHHPSVVIEVMIRLFCDEITFRTLGGGHPSQDVLDMATEISPCLGAVK